MMQCCFAMHGCLYTFIQLTRGACTEHSLYFTVQRDNCSRIRKRWTGTLSLLVFVLVSKVAGTRELQPDIYGRQKEMTRQQGE